MPIWSMELFVASFSSFVAVIIGSGGDVLFLSSILFLVPVLSHQELNAFALGPLVAIQGIVATLVGGIAYARITDLPRRFTFQAIGVVTAGSLSSSVVAYLLPGTALRIVLALAVTLGAGRVFLAPKTRTNQGAEGSGSIGRRVFLALFSVALLTGGLGVGGGFLFFIALMSLPQSGQELRGLTLILTCTNLVTSFIVHIMTISINVATLGNVAAGALVGSFIAILFIRRLTERVIRWGLRFLLIGSAVMSWIAVAPYLRF